MRHVKWPSGIAGPFQSVWEKIVSLAAVGTQRSRHQEGHACTDFVGEVDRGGEADAAIITVACAVEDDVSHVSRVAEVNTLMAVARARHDDRWQLGVDAGDASARG